MLSVRLLHLLVATASAASTCRAVGLRDAEIAPAAIEGGAESAEPQRQWATELERPGLPNLHRVAQGLYRGAQPEEEGYAELARLGVKTVVSLRSFHGGSKACERADLDYVRIPMQGWRVEDEDLIAFLRVVNDPERAPVFVHCEHGADRTGLATATYRAVVEDWSIEDARREMVEGGFGFHRIWRNLIRRLEELDVEELRALLAEEAEPQ